MKGKEGKVGRLNTPHTSDSARDTTTNTITTTTITTTNIISSARTFVIRDPHGSTFVVLREDMVLGGEGRSCSPQHARSGKGGHKGGADAAVLAKKGRPPPQPRPPCAPRPLVYP